MFLPYIHKGEATMNSIVYLLKYFGIVFTDGDWLNDWLTYLPPAVADAAQVIGQWIAPLFN